MSKSQKQGTLYMLSSTKLDQAYFKKHNRTSKSSHKELPPYDRTPTKYNNRSSSSLRKLVLKKEKYQAEILDPLALIQSYSKNLIQLTEIKSKKNLEDAMKHSKAVFNHNSLFLEQFL